MAIVKNVEGPITGEKAERLVLDSFPGQNTANYYVGPGTFDKMQVWEVWTTDGHQFSTYQVMVKEEKNTTIVYIYDNFLSFVFDVNKKYADDVNIYNNKFELLTKILLTISAITVLGFLLYIIFQKQDLISPTTFAALVMGVFPAATAFLFGRWGKGKV